MKTVVVAVFAIGIALEVYAHPGTIQQEQSPPPQQQAPPPQAPPQQPQAPAAPAPTPAVDQQEQQRQQQQQNEQQQRRLDEQRRQQFINSIFGDSSRPNQPRYSKPAIPVSMEHDPDFDLNSIPLGEWLQKRDVEEIPWNVHIQDTELRMDQRLEVSYVAAIQAKDANKFNDFYFLTLVANTAGEWLSPAKVVHHVMKGKIPDEAELHFTDYVFVRPGEYTLWLILHDPQTKRHNAMKRRITVSPIDEDLLPHAGDRLPPVQIPAITDRENGGILDFFTGLSLPVANKRQLHVELITILSPPEQWLDRRPIVRGHFQQTTGVLNTLAQIQLAQGSISLTGLDVVHRTVPLEQRNFEQLNRQGLTEVFGKLDKDKTVSLATLENRGGGTFLRESLDRLLSQPSSTMRIFFVVSSSYTFPRGSNLQGVKAVAGCNCRVYHLRFRHNINDVFDDVEKIIKPLSPKTYTLSSPRDFRKALAEIMKNLESL